MKKQKLTSLKSPFETKAIRGEVHIRLSDIISDLDEIGLTDMHKLIIEAMQHGPNELYIEIAELCGFLNLYEERIAGDDGDQNLYRKIERLILKIKPIGLEFRRKIDDVLIISKLHDYMDFVGVKVDKNLEMELIDSAYSTAGASRPGYFTNFIWHNIFCKRRLFNFLKPFKSYEIDGELKITKFELEDYLNMSVKNEYYNKEEFLKFAKENNLKESEINEVMRGFEQPYESGYIIRPMTREEDIYWSAWHQVNEGTRKNMKEALEIERRSYEEMPKRIAEWREKEAKKANKTLQKSAALVD